jgi:uncharacterized membrane protein
MQHREHFANEQEDEPGDIMVWLRTPHESAADATETF